MNKATDFLLDMLPAVALIGIMYLLVKAQTPSDEDED